jgi:hypothetical protein
MRDSNKPRSWLGRVRITPATVLVTVAVVLAAGGGAYAATAGSGQQSNGRASGPIHGPFATTSGAPFVAAAAVVNSNATLARGVRVTSVSRPFVPGTYQVLFTHNVNRCAFEATLGDPGAHAAPNGQIGVATRSNHKNGVYVQTYNSSGSLTPEPFHLVVIC